MSEHGTNGAGEAVHGRSEAAGAAGAASTDSTAGSAGALGAAGSRRAASPTGLSLAAMTYVFAAVMIGTTMPTPLFPSYQLKYGFGELTTTILFAEYAVGVLLSLILFGQASQRFGRRRVLLLGTVLSLVSTVLFAASGPLALLVIGRIVSGFSAGIFMATGTVAVLENAPATRRVLAAALATAANIGGLGLGILFSGIIAEVFADPLRAPYLVHGALLVLAGIALLGVRETVVPVPGTRLVRLPRVPHEARRMFAASSIGAVTGFAVCSIFSSIGAGFLAEVLGVHDIAIIGVCLSLLFIASTITQIALRGLPDRALVAIGAVALSAGMALLIVSLHTAVLGVFLASSAVSGIGQGLLFMAGMRASTAVTPPAERTQLTTAYFVVAYAALSVPPILAGLATLVLSLRTVGTVCAAIVLVASIVGLVKLRAFSRERPGG